MLYLLLGAFLFYLTCILPAQWLKIEVVRHPLGLGIKILQISDLHVEMLRIRPKRLEKAIQKERPDFIVLTGDFTRKEKYLSRLEPYLNMISRIKVPTYAVLGNHDYKLKNIDNLIQRFAMYHIRVLRNETIQFDRFQLIGIDDFDTGHSNVQRSFEQSNDRKPKILITHDPNVVLDIHRKFDYFMAGHLHGKQFNLPFFFKIKRKGALPAKGIYKGLHHNRYGTFYISKGIGQAGINVRFLVRSEMTVHHL